MAKKLDDEWPPFNDELDEADEDMMLDGWFKAECRELRRRALGPSDVDLPSKARALLRAGANGVLAGKPSGPFLAFIAMAIVDVLEGRERSLDTALRLVAPKGRPLRKTPDEEYEVVAAYIGAMWEQSDLPRSMREKQRHALIAAFKADHGHTPDELRARDANSVHVPTYVKDKMSQTRELLRRWHYL